MSSMNRLVKRILFKVSRRSRARAHAKFLDSSSDEEDSPDYGRRIIVNVVDDIAATDPNRPYMYIPLSNEAKDGYKPFTYGQYASAINHVAHAITEMSRQPGYDSSEEFPTIAYIGPHDIRYQIMILACVKAHHKVFLVSPRNSLAASVSLFKATKSQVLVHADPFSDLAQEWLAAYPMQSVEALSVDFLLNVKPKYYPYNVPFEEARFHPFVTIHTSGSTGIPKPIVMKLGSVAIGDGLRNLPPLDGSPCLWSDWATKSKKCFMPMPLFHLAGIMNSMVIPIAHGQNACLGFPDRILSVDSVIDGLRASGAQTATLPPSIIEEMARTEDGLESLKKLDSVAFGGGHITPGVGDELSKKGVRMLNIISSSECAPYLLHVPRDPDLWKWFAINEEAMGAEFRPIDVGEEGIYEMFLKRKDLKTRDPGLQALFYTFPDKDEWSTSDIYKKHPTLPCHWMYVGRADNVIVFSNGEKLNPVDVEGAAMTHPEIKTAMVVGAQRFQPALILEPYEYPKTEEEAQALIDRVWPNIEEVNVATVAHGRISRRMIVVSDPEKPFVQTPKRSLQRVGTVALYKDFIDELYEKAEHDMALQIPALDISSVENLTASIVNLLVGQLGAARVTPETDLFSVGVDSLQIMNLAKLLRSGLEAAGVKTDANTVAPRVIYSNPIPKVLASVLYSKATGESFGVDENAREIKDLEAIIAKYTADLPAPNHNQPSPLDDGQTVLVTGTTGSLGAYMLDRLVKNFRVKRIVAMNRGSDGGASRQPAYNKARGLTTDFTKVDFIGVDLSQPTWGLTQQKYSELLASADRIIHNAWPVNFNINIRSFEPYIRGVRHLVDFSNKAAKKVAIIFISSVGTAASWGEQSPVPEGALTDLTMPEMGYGRSKAAGSLILDAAAKTSGVPAASIRVGLIVGPRGKEGMWNKQEFMPSLIASSVYLGALPESIGPHDVIDWTPVEDVAGTVLDVAGISEPKAIADISGYFHCVNPCSTSWTSIAQALRKFYGERIAKVVPFAEWIALLEKSAEDAATADPERNPAIKLVDTYRGFLAQDQAGLEHVYFRTARTQMHSETLSTLGAVNGELMRHWCEQWKF